MYEDKTKLILDGNTKYGWLCQGITRTISIKKTETSPAMHKIFDVKDKTEKMSDEYSDIFTP